MILQAAKEKLGHTLYLFYSNRRPEDAAFLDELQTVEKQNPNYKFIGTMTDMEESKRPWQGATDRITGAMMSKWVKGLNGPVYYTAGPPGMVAAMRQMLATSGIGDDDIRTEEFSGY
jgi:ferredoxin-NADP reductase